MIDLVKSMGSTLNPKTNKKGENINDATLLAGGLGLGLGPEELSTIAVMGIESRYIGYSLLFLFVFKKLLRIIMAEYRKCK